MKRRAFAFALACGTTAAASVVMKPNHRAAEFLPPIDLEKQVPTRFGSWQIDTGVLPILPSPDVQALLNTIYNQTLARTYVDAAGQRIMLSIAYGSDQGTDATAAHRPEFCYTAQGFSVGSMSQAEVAIAKRKIVVRRLVGRLNARTEPITYWVTLNDSAVLPGVRRKVKQIQLGLQGQIPDGMLVRVSNISVVAEQSYLAHVSFLNEMAAAMAPAIVDRYFGKASV